MSGKDLMVQFEPKISQPIDNRMSVSTYTELENLGNRYDNMRVFVEDTQSVFYFVLWYSSDDFADNANRVIEAQYNILTGWGQRIEYWKINMQRNNTETEIPSGINDKGRRKLRLAIKAGDYDDCLVDFVWINWSTNEEEARFDWIRLWSEADMLAFVAANFTESWGWYTLSIYAIIYDNIDTNIPEIKKVNGVNMALSSTIGRKHRYKRDTISHVYISYTSINYTPNIKALIQDLIREVTPNNTYTYVDADRPERLIRRPSNHRKMYGMLHADAQVNAGHTRRVISDTWTFTDAIWKYDVQHNASKYVAINNATHFHTFFDKDDIKNVMFHIESPEYSVMLAYQLKSWDNYAVYLKPVWIDTIYVDRFDATKYKLFAVSHARNQYIEWYNVDVVTGIDDQKINNTSMIDKEQWMNSAAGTDVSKWWYFELPAIRFVLRDIATWNISSPSKARIERRSWRDKPLYATVNY